MFLQHTQGNREHLASSLSGAAVHREELGGGEHGEDPKEEAGPGGEGIRLS